MKDVERARQARIEEGQRMRESMGEVRQRQEAERQAALEAGLAEKRAAEARELAMEEAAWARLDGLAAIRVTDLPGLSAAAMRARLSKDESKKVFKELNLRWHPDKFLPKFSKCITPEDLEAVKEAVNKTWRNLRGYSEKHEGKR
jgi:hypothetical protein